MSEYVIRKTPKGVIVCRDGERVELKGLFDAIAEPQYDFGGKSVSTMNLGYAILRDCVGEAAAGQLYEEFTRLYMMENAMELSIQAEAIMAWAKRMAMMMADAQNKPDWKQNSP